MNVTPTAPGNSAAVEPAPGRTPRKNEATGNARPSAGKTVPAQRPAPPPISIEKALAQIKAYLSDSRRQLNFQVDENSGRTIIKVVNPASGEVIRQIPSEEVIKLAQMLDEQGFRTLNELA